MKRHRIAPACADQVTLQTLRRENAMLRQQLRTYQALLQPPTLAPIATTIATRWQAVHWAAVLEHDSATLVRAALTDGAAIPLIDLAAPTAAQGAALALAAQAPTDIQALLALLGAAQRIEQGAQQLITTWQGAHTETALDRALIHLANLVDPATRARQQALEWGVGELFSEDETV